MRSRLLAAFDGIVTDAFACMFGPDIYYIYNIYNIIYIYITHGGKE